MKRFMNKSKLALLDSCLHKVINSFKGPRIRFYNKISIRGLKLQSNKNFTQAITQILRIWMRKIHDSDPFRCSERTQSDMNFK